MLKKEVEREVLALILIVIIITSLLGTWAIVKVIDMKQKPKIIDNYNDGALVSLVVLPFSGQTSSEKNSREGDGS